MALRTDPNADAQSFRTETIREIKLVERLGSGRTGVVFLGLDHELERWVAVKIVSDRFLKENSGIDRLSDEVKSAAKLHHPYVCPIYASGFERGIFFLIMEFVEGGSLSDMIQDHPLDPEQAARFLCQAAEALQYAQDIGVTHGGLKPSNLLWDKKNGRVMVTDFRLSSVAVLETNGMDPRVSMDTACYMSPEQAQELVPDGRSDVYALGVILYKATTGRLPFQGPTPLSTLCQVISQTPKAPRQIRRDIPKDLEMIILKAMQKEKESRYLNPGELRDDLRRFLRGEMIQAKEAEERPIAVYWRQSVRGKNGAETLVSMPEGCRAAENTVREPYTGTGYARRIIHEKSGIELAFIPAGEGWIGSGSTPAEEADRWGGLESWYESEHPRHEVHIPRPFYMGIAPVTNGQYRSFLSANQYDGKQDCDENYLKHFRSNGMSKERNHPVVWVSWKNAMAFCEWAKLRLPSEAEWEYACRAGTETPWFTGSQEGTLPAHAWFKDNSKGRTQTLAKLPPNSWELHDMHGNVWEWCEDVWHDDYKEAPSDGNAWLEGGDSTQRVLRGGSCQAAAHFCRSCHRHSHQFSYSLDTYGFRVVLPI